MTDETARKRATQVTHKMSASGLSDEAMKAAEKAYRAASVEHTKIRTEFGNMLDHPDGAHAEHQAAKSERAAFENYARALKAFTDLTVDGRRPIPSSDPESQ